MPWSSGYSQQLGNAIRPESEDHYFWNLLNLEYIQNLKISFYYNMTEVESFFFKYVHISIWELYLWFIVTTWAPSMITFVKHLSLNFISCSRWLNLINDKQTVHSYILISQMYSTKNITSTPSIVFICRMSVPSLLNQSLLFSQK